METTNIPLKIIFPSDVHEVQTGTIASYLQPFGRIISMTQYKNEFNICLELATNANLVDELFNCCHLISGQEAMIRRGMHILELNLFCLTEICKFLVDDDDLCSVAEVCTQMKDAAMLAFQVSSANNHISNTKDDRVLHNFGNLMTSLEIHPYSVPYLEYLTSEVDFGNLKRLVCNGPVPDHQLKDLRAFKSLEVFSCRKHSIDGMLFPSTLKTFSVDGLKSYETAVEISANLKKIVLNEPFFPEKWLGSFLRSLPRIIEFVLIESYVHATKVLDVIIDNAPQLEVLGFYHWEIKLSPDELKTLKKLEKLKVLNILIPNATIDDLNVIHELNIAVFGLVFDRFQDDGMFFETLAKFEQIKFLQFSYRIKEDSLLVQLSQRLPQLTKLYVLDIEFNSLKQIIKNCDQLIDFCTCILRNKIKYDIQLHSQIVEIVKSKPNRKKLRFYMCSSQYHNERFNTDYVVFGALREAFRKGYIFNEVDA